MIGCDKLCRVCDRCKTIEYVDNCYQHARTTWAIRTGEFGQIAAYEQEVFDALDDPAKLAELIFAGGKARGVDVELKQHGKELSNLCATATIWFGYDDGTIQVRCRDGLGVWFRTIDRSAARKMLRSIMGTIANESSKDAVLRIYCQPTG